MGEKVVADRFDLSDRRRYREKLHTCLRGLWQLLEEKRFDRPRNLMGLEIELNLADVQGQPLMVNAEVLQRIASSDFQTELGQFNLEVNIVPHALSGRVLDQLAEELRTGLAYADRQAREVDARIVMIGTLPTLTARDLTLANLTEDDRYRLLNDQIMAARGEEVALDIEGVEHLVSTSESIAPESACTSVQLHLQVTPGRFADVWNAAQAVSAAQVAMGANSPFLFGHELLRESRVPLFVQATDTRPPELISQGVRPRTWFGERWISSAYDLFEENLRYFPALLPICDEEDPTAVLASGGVPALSEPLHNGTIYRWNRPVYGVVDGAPHLRVENRVLPAGPTVTDVLANTAFYYGLVRALADEPRPVWNRCRSSTPSGTSTRRAVRNRGRAGVHQQGGSLRWERRSSPTGSTCRSSDRRRYREKLHTCLRGLWQLLGRRSGSTAPGISWGWRSNSISRMSRGSPSW